MQIKHPWLTWLYWESNQSFHWPDSQKSPDFTPGHLFLENILYSDSWFSIICSSGNFKQTANSFNNSLLKISKTCQSQLFQRDSCFQTGFQATLPASSDFSFWSLPSHNSSFCGMESLLSSLDTQVREQGLCSCRAEDQQHRQSTTVSSQQGSA